MSENLKSFEVTVGKHDLSLQLGNCAVKLFRQASEVDYLAVDIGNDQVLRIFNNPDFARWLAGYQPVTQDGEVSRPTTRLDINGVHSTFRELVGWNPSCIEMEQPPDSDMEMFLDVNLLGLDEEWRGGI